MNQDADSEGLVDLLVDVSVPPIPTLASLLTVQDNDIEDSSNDDLFTSSSLHAENEANIDVYESYKEKRTENCSRHTSNSDSDPLLLEEEQFDFDVPNWVIDSNSSTDNETADVNDTAVADNGNAADDEEIFFGPVRHTEKCIASAVNERAKVNEQLRPLKPLNAAEMALLCREACTIASRLEIAAGVANDAASDQTDTVNCTDTLRMRSDVSNPLESSLTTVSVALPAVNMPCDSNGIVQFTGATAAASVGGNGATQSIPSHNRPVVLRRSGEIRSKKTASIKPFSQLNALQKTRNLPVNVNSHAVKVSSVASEEHSEMDTNKQFVTTQPVSSKQSVADDANDAASVTSDTNDSSTVNPMTGKRCLPQPMFNRKTCKVAPSSDAGVADASSSATKVLLSDDPRVANGVQLTAQQTQSSSRIPPPGSRLMKSLKPPRNVGSGGQKVSATTAGHVALDGSSGVKRELVKPSSVPELTNSFQGPDKRKTLLAVRTLTAGQAPGSVAKGTTSVCLPSATSTPCRPINRHKSLLNDTLCTPRIQSDQSSTEQLSTAQGNSQLPRPTPTIVRAQSMSTKRDVYNENTSSNDLITSIQKHTAEKELVGKRVVLKPTNN